MSQENVELVRSLMPAPGVDLARIVRDEDSWEVAASADRLTTDFECVQNVFGTPKTYAGPDGLRAMLTDWLAPWTTYRVEVDDAIDCGEQVVLLGRVFGRRGDSTEEVSGEMADVWTVRDGKIARWEALPSRQDALKAVGLEE